MYMCVYIYIYIYIYTHICIGMHTYECMHYVMYMISPGRPVPERGERPGPWLGELDRTVLGHMHRFIA